ncbi:MAG TPA: hypothetical protein VFA47_03460 [Candidatus Manganitrophaceae bacterium]|nr:hypothetical protein [Candidatus Manganitrophaceae bacterium]
MRCRRCHGMMITDHINDERGRAAHPVFRCILCGEIIDPIILMNRKERSLPPLSRRRFSRHHPINPLE